MPRSLPISHESFHCTLLSNNGPYHTRIKLTGPVHFTYETPRFDICSKYRAENANRSICRRLNGIRGNGLVPEGKEGAVRTAWHVPRDQDIRKLTKWTKQKDYTHLQTSLPRPAAILAQCYCLVKVLAIHGWYSLDTGSVNRATYPWQWV